MEREVNITQTDSEILKELIKDEKNKNIKDLYKNKNIKDYKNVIKSL